MLRLFAAALMAALFALAAASPARAQFGDIFGGYTQGREAAIRDNQRDAYMYAYTMRQAIENDFRGFSLTGDWEYLCHAYMLGSVAAERHLYENDMRCRFIRQ
jgi:hypothetical protein